MKIGRRGRLALMLLVPFVAMLATGIWHTVKPLPPGLHVSGPFVAVDEASLRFLPDVTAADPYGRPVLVQNIHAATLELVRGARDFLVLDYFLFNGQGGPKGPLQYERGLKPVAQELIDALRELKTAQPGLPILLMTDPINDYYRGSAPPALAALEQLGVQVAVTRLDPLRDSNPTYSAPWRLLGSWWMKPDGEGSFSNPLDGAGPELRLGALLRIPQFKANHRKLAITGDGLGSLRGIVSSGNPHDASSAHSNVALYLAGEALRPLLRSELAVAGFSGEDVARFQVFAAPAAAVAGGAGDTRAAIATEGAILDRLLERLQATGRGDAIDVAQFYLSNRGMIDALLDAARRGVDVRVLLDPNRDAFGFEKSGIPNRQVASELITAGGGALHLRWYRTHGEQFHVKFLAVRSAGRLWFSLGSANFTRRNLGDYNLEANVIVDTRADGPLAADIGRWYETLWTNHPGGIEYSSDGDTYAEASQLRYWLYRFMEAGGLSTF
jgi:hypothetical protein